MTESRLGGGIGRDGGTAAARRAGGDALPREGTARGAGRLGAGAMRVARSSYESLTTTVFALSYASSLTMTLGGSSLSKSRSTTGTAATGGRRDDDAGARGSTARGATSGRASIDDAAARVAEGAGGRVDDAGARGVGGGDDGAAVRGARGTMCGDTRRGAGAGAASASDAIGGAGGRAAPSWTRAIGLGARIVAPRSTSVSCGRGTQGCGASDVPRVCARQAADSARVSTYVACAVCEARTQTSWGSISSIRRHAPLLNLTASASARSTR